MNLKQILIAIIFLVLFSKDAIGDFDLSTISSQAANNRNPEEVLRLRLIAIFENIPPSMEYLENEFDFSYQKSPSHNEKNQNFYATGKLPFDPGFASSYVMLLTSNQLPSFFLSFDFAHSNQFRTFNQPQFCLLQKTMETQLLSRGWNFSNSALKKSQYFTSRYKNTDPHQQPGAN